MIPAEPNRETLTEREERLYRSRYRAMIAKTERWTNALMDRILDAGHAINGEWLHDCYLEERARQLDEFERREARRKRSQG